MSAFKMKFAMNERKRKLNRFLAVLVFFFAGYLSLNYSAEGAYDYLLGILFLIAGVYGAVKVGRGKRFIF